MPLSASSFAMRLAELQRLGGEDPGEAPGIVGRRLDVVDDEGLGDLLDAVEHVVEARDQVVDVLAVERRDERPVEPRLDLVVDLVALVLEAWISVTRSSSRS